VSLGREDLTDNQNYIRFNLAGSVDKGVEDSPYYTNAEFYFVTIINNRLVEFDGHDFDITNINLDPATGRLTFDYSCTVDYNNSKTGTVTGKGDVILNRGHKRFLSLD
jgi:hypothetical protein